MATQWKNLPDRNYIAKLADAKDLKKESVSGKVKLFIEGGIPGSEGDVKGITVTVDPNTYVMTTQLKDGAGGNVGSPATVDLPLESMVVSGEYDEDTKSIILTLKNGQTVSFSVADLVSGLQTEITSENPLDADLIDDSSSNQKLVTNDEKQALEEIVTNGAYMYATMTGGEGYAQFDNDNACHFDVTAMQNGSQPAYGVGMTIESVYVELANGRSADISHFDSYSVRSSVLEPGTYSFDPSAGVRFYVDESEQYEITDAGTIIIGPSDGEGNRSMYFYPADGSNPILYGLDSSGELTFFNTLVTDGDVANYQPLIDNDNKLYSDLVDDTNATNKFMTSAEKTKLAGIASGAEVNVQADWNQTNSSADDYIKNKPTSLGGKKFYYDAESAGSILYVENVAIYKDPELTESATGEDVFQALNEGTVNLIGMVTNDTPYIPWSSEAIVSSADDGMDGTGRNLFFHVFGLGIRGTIGWSNDSQAWVRYNVERIGDVTTNDLNARVKQGQGAPTTSTVGSKGQLYEDTTNGKVYVCTNRSGNTTTWKELVKAGDNISGLNNDSGYQNASQVSSAITSAIGGITSFDYQVVQALPASGVKGTIYLVPTEESGEPQNIYEEYIWVIDEEESGDTGHFELIGTTQIDLSDYVTNSDLHDYTASVAFTSENGIEITDDDNNSIGFAIETDAETGSQNLAVTGSDGSFNVPNAEDVADALAGKADAINPSDLPSGSTQNGVITTSDHTDIDPSVVSEGQIVVDSTDGKVYIVSDITTDPQTGDPVIVWKEIQTDKEVLYVDMTVTSLQDMTFTVSGYTAYDICLLLDAGVNVIYRLNLTQSLPGLAAGVYDFRPIMHVTNASLGGVMSTMTGPSGSNSILGVASHTDGADSTFEMRQLANASDIPEDMVILDYGTSTWSDFLAAYNDNRVVYCRASSGTDPSAGTKTRLAFMAYVNNSTSPTEVEFQYLRSVSNKSASSQCDQVFVYKLTSANGGTWTVETRNTMVKIVAGTNMTSSYASGSLTLSADLSSKQDVIDATHKLSADLIDSSTSDDKTYQTGTGAPTTSTTGSVGEMYVDKSTGTVYVCTDDTGGTYTWVKAGTITAVKANGTLIASSGEANIPAATTTNYGVTELTESSTSGATGKALAACALNNYSQHTVTGAPVYSTSYTYNVGDLVRRGDYTWRCNTAITTPEEWNASHWTGLDPIQRQIDNLATVAKTGSYADLSNKPTIPTVNNATLTIQKNGTTVQTFTANASSNKTANIEVPVITMQTTDPGEGVALAANNFIAVYEA